MTLEHLIEKEATDKVKRVVIKVSERTKIRTYDLGQIEYVDALGAPLRPRTLKLKPQTNHGFMHLIVAISGASGVIYGERMLEACKELKIETDLIVSRTAEKILEVELGKSVEEIQRLATRSYSPEDLMAPLVSGSYRTDGMVIIPCSMKTLGALASGMTGDLISRAADVTLKENRPLVLVPRETPLNLIHLGNMVKLKHAGAIILPAMPAFYGRPKKISDLVDFVVGRVLDVLGVEHKLYKGWRSQEGRGDLRAKMTGGGLGKTSSP